MMNNELLLAAISDMLDQKLDQKLEQKLDQKLDQKLEPIYGQLASQLAKIDNIEATLNNKVLPKLDKTEQRLKKIECVIENDISPGLQNIESCYMSTYNRYQEGAAEHDAMKLDIQVLKTVVMEHSEKLQKIS